MSKATVSIFVFGVYAMIAGLGFLLIPNLVLPVFGLPETTEVWIRVVGLLAFFVGGYYITAALQSGSVLSGNCLFQDSFRPLFNPVCFAGFLRTRPGNHRCGRSPRCRVDMVGIALRILTGKICQPGD